MPQGGAMSENLAKAFALVKATQTGGQWARATRPLGRPALAESSSRAS